MASRREVALNLRSIFSDAAQLSVFPAAMGAVACAVAAYHRNRSAAVVFASVAMVGAGVLTVARRLALDDDEIREGAALAVALAWLLIPVLGAVPLWLLAGEVGSMGIFSAPSNALFESMSSFTSTGLTVAPDVARLPPSVQLWRSMAQWVGGMGMVMFGLLVIRASSGLRALASEEVPDDTLHEHVTRSAKTILAVYVSLTAASIVGFWGFGMPRWAALNHGLTAVSTGGMTITGSSFQPYSASLKLVAMGAMMSGAVSFGLYLLCLRRRSLSVVTRSTQTRALLGVWLGGGLLLWWVARDREVDRRALDLAFEWTSAVSTTGYSTHDLGGWPLALLLLLVVMMIVGCAAGSTGGGIKLARLVWIVKRIFMRVAKLSALMPRSTEERTYHFDGERVSPAEAQQRFAEAGVLASLWLVTLALGILGLVLLQPEASMYRVVFDATSALGGVGLSTGFVSAELHPTSKLLLTLLMWLGRLEIVTVLSLLAAPPALVRAAWRRSEVQRERPAVEAPEP